MLRPNGVLYTTGVVQGNQIRILVEHLGLHRQTKIPHSNLFRSVSFSCTNYSAKPLYKVLNPVRIYTSYVRVAKENVYTSTKKFDSGTITCSRLRIVNRHTCPKVWWAARARSAPLHLHMYVEASCPQICVSCPTPHPTPVTQWGPTSTGGDYGTRGAGRAATSGACASPPGSTSYNTAPAPGTHQQTHTHPAADTHSTASRSESGGAPSPS